MLTDARFKLLALVPTVSAIGVVVADTRTRADAIGIALIGLIATSGILIYDLRNSQLYGAALHRAKQVEKRLGLRRSNPPTAPSPARLAGAAIWHDRALAFVYAAAITGWTYVLAAAYPVIERCVSTDRGNCLSEQSLKTAVSDIPTPWVLLILAAAGLLTGMLVHAFDRRGPGSVLASSGMDPNEVKAALVIEHANRPRYARPRPPAPATAAADRRAAAAARRRDHRRPPPHLSTRPDRRGSHARRDRPRADAPIGCPPGETRGSSVATSRSRRVPSDTQRRGHLRARAETKCARDHGRIALVHKQSEMRHNAQTDASLRFEQLGFDSGLERA